MDKKQLSETDIRTKYITPAICGLSDKKWDLMSQIREEAYFTKGRVIVRGKTVHRGEAKKADYLLFYKPNLPIAVVEAKDNSHSVGAGMQQALEYAEILDVPFAYSSNGDAFLEHDRTATGSTVTREIPLDQFPTPDELWNRYCIAKGLTDQQKTVVTQDYYDDGSQKSPRYYQRIAINRTVDAIARGEDRILLVMATGTGKTYTAFQIIWRLWKAGTKKRILFLVDRNILADQTKTNDFKPFGKAMTKITNRTVDKSYEIYLCLYQAVTGTAEDQNIYKQFSPDFFDLVIVDECHRGSAADDAAWRQVLEYFSSATQIGLTAARATRLDVLFKDLRRPRDATGTLPRRLSIPLAQESAMAPLGRRRRRDHRGWAAGFHRQHLVAETEKPFRFRQDEHPHTHGVRGCQQLHEKRDAHASGDQQGQWHRLQRLGRSASVWRYL
jgi:type I restriction enzyme R subunit